MATTALPNMKYPASDVVLRFERKLGKYTNFHKSFNNGLQALIRFSLVAYES